MQTLTLIIALVALVIALIALYRTGAIGTLRERMDRISTKTEGAAKTTRAAAANALGRVEQLIRGKEKMPPEEPQIPAKKASTEKESVSVKH